MSANRLQIAVVGLGALGGPTAIRLKQHTPHSIYGVTSRAETAQHYTQHGLVVKWVDRLEPPVYLDAVVGNVEDLPSSLDIVFLATKADALPHCLPILARKLKPTGLLVTFQNGYVLDAVVPAIGAERTAAASIVWTATLQDDRSFWVTQGGNFKLGGLPQTPPAQVQLAASLLQVVFPVEVSSNIAGVLWSKLCVNCCVTAVGAITGLTFGQQTAHADLRRLFFRIITETILVGQAHGIRFEKLNGKLSPLWLSDLGGWPPRFVRHFFLKMIGKKYGNAESSMLQSLRRGKKPEIDEINGIVAEFGRKANVPTPTHDRIIRLVYDIGEGRRTVGTHNLPELLAGL
jgi:2-dehydropantoate 2-reductase